MSVQKPTLIFLHGGPGFKDYLSPFFSELKKSFNTVFYDQLQGDSVTMDDLIVQLDEIVEAAHGPRILVGHSWGGVLAGEYAGRFPDKLNGLVIMSTGLNFKQWNDDFKAEKTRLGLLDAAPEAIFLTRDEQEVGKPFLDQTWVGFSGESFDSLYESYITTFDLTKTISELNLPILYIYGDKDVRFPASVASTIKNLNSKIVELRMPDAGHFPFLLEEGRKQMISKITEFVNTEY